MSMTPDAISAAAQTLHERASAWDKLRADPAAPIVANIRTTAERLKSFARLVSSRNPKDTRESHILKIEAARQKLVASEPQTWLDFSNAADRLRADITARIDRTANLVPTADAAEIRAVLRGMSLEDRLKAVSDAAANGNADILAALTGKDPLLTGVPLDHLDAMVKAHRAKTAPEEFADLERVEEAYKTARVAAGLVSQAITSTRDSVSIERVLREIAAAEAAQSEFDETTTGVTAI